MTPPAPRAPVVAARTALAALAALATLAGCDDAAEPAEVDGAVAGDGGVDAPAVCAKPLVYLNGLLAGAETYSPGPDDSRNNTTRLLQAQATVGPMDASRVAGILAATRAIFEPMGIEVTDVAPGNVAHLEVVLVGSGWPLPSAYTAVAAQACRLQTTGIGLVNGTLAGTDRAIAASAAYVIGLLSGLDLTDAAGNCMVAGSPATCTFADGVNIPQPRCGATRQDQRRILAAGLACP